MRSPLMALMALVALAVPAAAQFRPLYLSGKVTLPDGSEPPEPVLMRLYCADGRQPQAYTDRHGAFNFPVGGTQQERIMDASRSLPDAPVGASGSDRSFVSMIGCELMAYLPGYTSTKIQLGRRSVFESPDVGVIIIRPVAAGEATLVSLNTLQAPEKARKSFEKAEKELAKSSPDPSKAAKDLQKAVEEFPAFSAAWNLLGDARLRMKDFAGARAALDSAIAAEPKFAPPYLILVRLDLTENRMEDAVKAADLVLELAPGLAEAHYYRAIALTGLGRDNEAEVSLKAVEASGEAERYPRTHFMLGNILVGRGDIPGAAAQFRQFLAEESGSRAAEVVRQELEKWQAEGLLK
ncbi:MAG: tetratricopeptide repeat protein [Bryobacteraceae bacterium]|nr:tetratricopeptide repeat protein [Bryobacteraceae bacterium]